MNKSEVDEKTKATLVLCYGFVALYAPVSLIASRLETSILRAINPHFYHVKVTNRCRGQSRLSQIGWSSVPKVCRVLTGPGSEAESDSRR